MRFWNLNRWQQLWLATSVLFLIFTGMAVVSQMHADRTIKAVLSNRLSPNELERYYGLEFKGDAEFVAYKVALTSAVYGLSLQEAQTQLRRLIDPEYMDGQHEDAGTGGLSRETPIATVAYLNNTTIQELRRAASITLDAGNYASLVNQVHTQRALLWAKDFGYWVPIWALLSALVYVLGLAIDRLVSLLKTVISNPAFQRTRRNNAPRR